MTAYVRALKRLGWLLIALPLIGVLVAFGLSRIVPTTYEARATILIKPAPPLSPIDGDVKNLNTQEILQTNALLMTQPVLLGQVSNELSLGRSVDELAQQVDVKAQPSTTLLIVTVRDRNPKLAQDIANQLVSDYLVQSNRVRQDQVDAYISRMQARLTETEKLVSDEQLRLTALQAIATPSSEQLGQRATLQQQIQADQAHYSGLVQNLAQVEAQAARGSDTPIFVSHAVQPAGPVSPNVRLNVAIGAFGGVLIGLLLILLLAPAALRQRLGWSKEGRDADFRRTANEDFQPTANEDFQRTANEDFQRTANEEARRTREGSFRGTRHEGFQRNSGATLTPKDRRHESIVRPPVGLVQAHLAYREPSVAVDLGWILLEEQREENIQRMEEPAWSGWLAAHQQTGERLARWLTRRGSG